MEYKSSGFVLPMKEVGGAVGDSEGWIFSGIASSFGPPADLTGDIIDRHAYDLFLKNYEKQGISMPILWSHSPDNVIGKVLTLAATDYGLLVSFKLEPVRQGVDTRILLDSKCVSGLSIGYSADEFTPGRQTGVRRVLNRITLMEISVCAFPANLSARVGVSKHAAIADELTCMMFEDELKRVPIHRMPAWKVRNYVDAQQRILDRLLLHGKTQKEFLDEIVAEIQELEELGAAV